MIGLDVGTSTLQLASEEKVTIQRNAFLTIDKEHSTLQMLSRMQVPYIEIDGKLHLVGKDAINFANIFGSKELKRPMKDGLLNPVEKDALPILSYLLASLLKDQPKGAQVVYCVPAAPIDIEREIDYHQDTIKTILEHHGYKARAINEAVALGLSSLKEDQLTGIAISFGAGMVNVAIMYMGLSALQFSVSKSGDWVDKQVAADCGISLARAQQIKEKADYSIALDGQRKLREHNSIRANYGALIRYILANIAHQFNSSKETPSFPFAVPIVVGGGTSMIPGFLDMFREEFTQADFPIEISEIRHAEEPLTAVARGCLEEAKLEAN